MAMVVVIDYCRVSCNWGNTVAYCARDRLRGATNGLHTLCVGNVTADRPSLGDKSVILVFCVIFVKRSLDLCKLE